jgi:hypothetical protein
MTEIKELEVSMGATLAAFEAGAVLEAGAELAAGAAHPAKRPVIIMSAISKAVVFLIF